MAIVSRTASEPCAYWSSGLGAHCVANAYFSILSISCYNSGACDGAGTCLDCSRYDRFGLKMSTLSYTDALRETSDDPASHSQTPLNVAIYNLRAKFAKCCYWQGKTLTLSMNQDGDVFPNVVLPGAGGGTQSLCSNTAAAAWQVPWKQGSLNNSKFPCNGARTSCPYYTGPTFEYIKDDKMEFGDKVSAAQIMELRYYSKDFTKYSNPLVEYEKTFSEPILWAWSGDFDDAVLDPATGLLINTPTELSIPGVHEVTLFRSGVATSFSSALSVGQKLVGQFGTPVKGAPPSFPTLIKELDDLESTINIVWPTLASAASPYEFRTFRIGLNTIYVIVTHDTDYPIYAVNMSKYPQATSVSDEDFILGMLGSNPDDVSIAEATPGMFGVVFSVELEYNPEVNEIKVFTVKDNSSDGSMHTEVCYVRHMFYHAHVAQTSFIDHYGQPVVEPYIDRFLDFSSVAAIKKLSKNEAVFSDVLWDTVAYNKSTIYETEEYFEEWVSDWKCLNCNLVALTLENINVNPTQSWKISGFPTALNIAHVELGIWADRSDNPNVPTAQRTSLLEMGIVERSTTGKDFPCNVIFVAPDSDMTAFDKAYDRFKVVIAYTVYKQGPVKSGDAPKLKHAQYVNDHIQLMPYEVFFRAQNKTIEIAGLSLLVVDIEGNEVKRLTIKDFENTLDSIYTDTVENEKAAIESFVNGGTNEDQLDYLGASFSKIRTQFDQENAGSFFEDGSEVTLSNFCELLSFVGYYEGTQEYRVIFSDNTGRPIGIKRFSLLMQSSVPSCRDVEIYYRWTINAAFVNAGDIHSLLARDYVPLRRSSVLQEYFYDPMCGDHSLQTESQTFYTKYETPSETVQWQQVDKDTLLASHPRIYGSPGALWYPYKACMQPTYNRADPMEDYVLCSRRVEGFLDGQRRSYWEATRGPDIFWTRRLGILTFIGCFWSHADGSFQTVQAPVFAGFTRVRSNHILGPFQADRESVRVSRHYIKRNLEVRNELISREGLSGVVSLSSAGTDQLFYSNGAPRTDEKPVWVHLVDGISTVNRTTPEAKHPFSNIVMVEEGDHHIDEAVQTARVSLKDAMEIRDLTRASERDTNGSLVFNPAEPRWDSSAGVFSQGKDVFWVFKDEKTVWSWLERPKDVERSQNGVFIGGVDLYNPTVDAWKKDLSSATRMDDGVYPLVYTPPTFLPDGSVQANPTLTLAGGIPREIDWITGVLAGAPTTWPVDPYDGDNHSSASGAVFQLFGKCTSIGGTDVNGFLADNAGLQEFEVSDEIVQETYRGLGVNPQIRVSMLPHVDLDLTTVGDGPAVKTSILALTSMLVPQTFHFDLQGYKFLSSIAVEANVGKTTDALFYLPTITVDGKLANDVWQTDVLRIAAKTSDANLISVQLSDGATNNLSAVRYKELRVNINILPQKRRIDITNFSITILDPVSRTEEVKVYDRKLNVSTGDTGNRAHADMLYYYGRTTANFGLNDMNYDEISGEDVVVDDLKWIGRTARDVILTFNFMDPTGTVFDFPNAQVTDIAGVQQAVSGYYHVSGPINIRTKTQTLVTKEHVSDPIGAKAAGLSWSNTVAKDEVSDCANAVQSGIRDEHLQECLFKEAHDVFGQRAVVRYESYWHPDEISFFCGTVGLTAMPTWTLVLESSFALLDKVMRHPAYGCNATQSNEYHDGKIHSIPIWQGLGHLMHLGNPVWNWTCTKVILSKVGRHLGTELFRTDPAAYVSSRTWPPDRVIGTKIESQDFYVSNENYWDNPSSYTGGVISVGIPNTIAEVEHYAPGGVPRGWLTELALFPITKSWPLGDDTVINGYRRFGKR